MALDGSVRQRGPRRARYLIPKGTPRRAEIIAGVTTAVLVAHLVIAQLTGVLAALLYTVTRVTRVRWSWLFTPAAVGLLWSLLVGPARAVAGLASGPRQVLGYFGGAFAEPQRLLHPLTAYAGTARWLPAQLPLALVLGAAEAAVAGWLSWLHTDEWRLPTPRPGLIALTRRLLTVRALRAGGVVTKDGAAFGVDTATGARVGLSWREIAGGVLCVGAAGSGKTTTCFQLVHAAVRRRKPVIVVDLTGDPRLVARMRELCAATGTPMHLFTANGPGWYEPLRVGDPARRAALVIGMVDWRGTAEQYRRSCAGYIQDVLAVVDAAPGDPRTSTLDEIVHLLNPAALQARAACIPAYHPQRAALLERARVSAGLLTADPQTATALASQLQELHVSPVGRWLRPDPYRTLHRRPPGAARTQIDLERLVRERAVVVFSLDVGLYGRAAATVAGLVAQDVLALSEELRRIGVDGDGLVWFDEFGPLRPEVVAELVIRGRDAGLPVLLSTSSAEPGERVADLVGAHLAHRLTDRGAAERVARLTGERLAPGEGPPTVPATGPSAAVPGAPPPAPAPVAQPASGVGLVRRPRIDPAELADRQTGEFTLAVISPRRRVVPLGRTVPARIGGAASPDAPGTGVAPGMPAPPQRALPTGAGVPGVPGAGPTPAPPGSPAAPTASTPPPAAGPAAAPVPPSATVRSQPARPRRPVVPRPPAPPRSS